MFCSIFLLLLLALLCTVCITDDVSTDGLTANDSTAEEKNVEGKDIEFKNDGDASGSQAESTEIKGASDPQAESAVTNKTEDGTDGRPEEGGIPLASLYIDTLKPGLGSPMTKTVFRDGKLVAPFNSCRLASHDSTRLEDSAECYEDDAFNDRLMFEITYRVAGAEMLKAFNDHPPNLILLGSSQESASSISYETFVDKADSTAKISIIYHCKSDSDAKISVQLRLQFSDADDGVIDIFWRKACKSGVNKEIEFGYVIRDKDSDEKEYHQFVTDADAPYVVPPGDVSTEIYMKLGVPGASQVFLAPFVSSLDSEVVTLSVRGNHPKGGILEGLAPTLIQINYECLKKGSSDIVASVSIPPFQNLTTTIKKECGGNIASKLRIGSTEGGFDIVDEGKPTPKYVLGIEHIGTEHSDAHLHMPGNQSDWTIYLSNGELGLEGAVEKDSALHMGRIGVTVENPEIIAAVSPLLSVHGTMGWRDVTNIDNDVYQGTVFRISFHFACRRIGESRLLISIPLRDYDILEFGLAKECDHAGTAHKSKQWILTVGNVFWGATFIFIAGLAVYCLKRRGKDTAGFARVPVVEQ